MNSAESHPLRVRGLKSVDGPVGTDIVYVAPFEGAWIEIGWIAGHNKS